MDIDKRMTLKDAVAKFIHDGDVVYYGGFQIHVPMALTHEIIRQKKRNLTTIESSTDVGGLDIMVGAGCVSCRATIPPSSCCSRSNQPAHN